MAREFEASDGGTPHERISDQGKKQIPERSAASGSSSLEIFHKNIGESQIPATEEPSVRTRAVQKIFDDSLVSVRSCLSSPRDISDLSREGFDSLAAIIIQNNDVDAASFMRTLDHNFPTGFYTDPMTVTRLFPGMLFGDTAAVTDMNTLLQAEKEKALADTDRSIPQTAGLRKLVTHYATHQLSPEEVINSFGIHSDHRTSLRLEYYHQVREVHGKESPLADLCREDLTRSFLREEEMNMEYAHEKALEVLCMQQDDNGRRAVFDRFKELDATVTPTRESFTRFRFTAREILHYPDMLTVDDADWIIGTANKYARAAEQDPLMEDDNMMAKYILPLEILIEQHRGAPIDQLIERQRNGTDVEVQGYPVRWIGSTAYHDEARFFHEMASIAAQQGNFADAGIAISEIRPVTWPTGNREVLLHTIQYRQEALQDCLREATNLSETDLLRRGEDALHPELASLIQMKEALLQGDSDAAIAQTRQFIESITDGDVFMGGDVFDKKSGVAYCIEELIDHDPEIGGILASEMANKLLEVNDFEYRVVKFAEIGVQQGNVSGLDALYRNAARYKRAPINQQFGAYAKVALLASKALRQGESID